MPSRRLLLRLPVAVALAVALGVAFAGPIVDRFLATDNIHGAVKGLLEAEQSALLHLPRDTAFALLCAVAAASLGPTASPSRRRALALAVGVPVALLLLWPAPTWLPAAVALPVLVAVNLLVPRLPKGLLRLPGVELLFPLPTLAALDLAGRPLVRAVAVLPLIASWATGDAWGGAFAYEPQVADWPDARVLGAEVLGHADPGVRCDFHDIDVVPATPTSPARAVLVTETALRLWSLDLPTDRPTDPSTAPTLPSTGDRSPPFDPRARFHPRERPPARDPRAWALPPWWGPAEGLVMDSETDPATDTTWFLDGPATVTALHWNGATWDQPRHSPPLPYPYTHAYGRWLPERNELVLVSVNARSPGAHPLVTTLRTPDLAVVRAGTPTLPDGSPLPTAREIAWVPPLGRLVIAPDFGDRLYLLDPDTLRAEPWIAFPAMDGKMEWVEGLGRLALATPSAFSVWLVDPRTGEVDRRIPTQPGVRAVAFDVPRGRMWTASVLTGAVLAQRIDDGAIERIYGTFMPMVRELRVLPDTGGALLGTWTRLYRLPAPG